MGQRVGLGRSRTVAVRVLEHAPNGRRARLDELGTRLAHSAALEAMIPTPWRRLTPSVHRASRDDPFMGLARDFSH
jgi:hypothetical protein